MIGILLILLETLASFYLLIAISVFLWSLLPISKEVPEEAQTSWSETFIAAIFWPFTMWMCITAFSRSIEEEDI